MNRNPTRYNLQVNIQSQIVTVTSNMESEFFRYVSAVPIEKLDWKPSDVGQSILSMCREVAVTPEWAMIGMGELEHSEEEAKARYQEVQSWDSVTRCQQEFDKCFSGWSTYVLRMPDSKLAETRWLPFNGGRDHTFLEMLEYPRWNITYHLGQVAYVQTLYGDKEMY